MLDQRRIHELRNEFISLYYFSGFQNSTFSLIFNFLYFFFRASITSSSDTQHNPYNSHFNPRVREKLKLYKDRDDKEIAMRKFANQTAQNVTFLLDHLLHQYDNSLRPDIRGILLKVHLKRPFLIEIAAASYLW